MPEITFDVELYCAKCGAGICGNGTVTRKRQQECIIIEPCETCIDRANDNGYEQGHEKGYAEAKDAYEVRP